MIGDFVPHAKAAHEAFLAGAHSDVRVLRTLHAKLIIIDEDIAYCGSANWYRYSLETSQEVLLRGPVAEASGLLDLAEQLWQTAIPLAAGPPPVQRPPKRAQNPVGGGYTVEAMDPIAAEVIKTVPGSFVLKRKPK
jgi:phosphatidylserine/phosphatidylglycerophosphate/cardiolipin synthase-like enzyme